MSTEKTMYAVAATNVPQGQFAEIAAGSEPGARFAARHLSKQHAGVSFTAFRVQPGEGAYAVASFLNGKPRFTAVQ